MPMSRRDLLKVGLFSSAALMLPVERVARTKHSLDQRIPTSQLPKPFSVPFVVPPVLAPRHATADTAYYELDQMEAKVEILPGLQTTIWGYNGIAPGPTLVNYRGQKAVVRQCNFLPDVHPTQRYKVWTSTHLHGSASAPQYDGYASDITRPNQWKDYQWPNFQDARTLWYHDHGVHITAENAYMGLAGMYILHDALELSLPIPHGDYDVPLILRDAVFERNGELIIDDQNESGIFGDVILVNGKPWPEMQVEPRKYRFRVLNASVARSFDLKLDTDEPMTVIGTDGGLMPQPQEITNIRVGMAERYEIVIDFSKYKPGQRVVLRNLQPPNNLEFDNTDVVMAFKVGATVTDYSNNEIPADLNPNRNVMGLQERHSQRTRKMEFERKNSSWTINGTTWADVVDSDYRKVLANPDLGDVEIWELENRSGGWFHPVHVHLVDFRILDRNGKPPEPYELGPKDVAYVGENETVRVIMRFEHHRGKYMIHCHNLSHEDHDMMGQFEVGRDGDDPIKADPSKDMPFGPLWPEEGLEVPDDLDDDSDFEDSSGSGSEPSVAAPALPSGGWVGGTAAGDVAFVSDGAAPSTGTPTPSRRKKPKPKPKRRRRRVSLRRKSTRSKADRREDRRKSERAPAKRRKGDDAPAKRRKRDDSPAAKRPKRKKREQESERRQVRRKRSKAKAIKRTEAGLRRRER